MQSLTRQDEHKISYGKGLSYYPIYRSESSVRRHRRSRIIVHHLDLICQCLTLEARVFKASLF